MFKKGEILNVKKTCKSVIFVEYLPVGIWDKSKITGNSFQQDCIVIVGKGRAAFKMISDSSDYSSYLPC